MEWKCGECGTPVWVRKGPKAYWYQCPKCGTRVYLGPGVYSDTSGIAKKDPSP